MIPKTIHYCWFGRGKFSSEIEMCIASWKKFCPDYEIKEWNEDNAPMNKPWVRDAYKHHKYAFMADYVRFWVLYNYGGVYMDTDMLLRGSLDPFLCHNCFMGREDSDNANMAIMGAVKRFDFCRICLEQYDSSTFNILSPQIITRFITPILMKYGLTEKDNTQYLTNGIVVYKSEYFYPIHYSDKFKFNDINRYITKNTVGIHLWNHSWRDEIEMLDAGEYKQGFKIVLKRVLRTPILPFKYYKKVTKYIVYWILGR